jgi:hypothetical protein
MANIYVTKDGSSLYLTNMLEDGEQIQYDWSLSKSYTMITSKGTANLLLIPSNIEHTCVAIGLHKIESGNQITVTATGQTIFIIPFLLNDDATMNELFPDTSTLTSLRASSSYLNPTIDNGVDDHVQLDYGSSGNKIFTLADLNTAVLGGLSL